MIINKLNDIINNSQTSDPRYMISSFIKQNILIINSLTIKEVADGSHVSKAMVSKFVKELGYDNFALPCPAGSAGSWRNSSARHPQ